MSFRAHAIAFLQFFKSKTIDGFINRVARQCRMCTYFVFKSLNAVDKVSVTQDNVTANGVHIVADGSPSPYTNTAHELTCGASIDTKKAAFLATAASKSSVEVVMQWPVVACGGLRWPAVA